MDQDGYWLASVTDSQGTGELAREVDYDDALAEIKVGGKTYALVGVGPEDRPEHSRARVVGSRDTATSRPHPC